MLFNLGDDRVRPLIGIHTCLRPPTMSCASGSLGQPVQSRP